MNRVTRTVKLHETQNRHSPPPLPKKSDSQESEERKGEGEKTTLGKIRRKKSFVGTFSGGIAMFYSEAIKTSRRREPLV